MRDRTLALFGLAILVAWPAIPGVPHDLISTAILATEYLIVALSLVLLIGQVGQISLGQAAFVGMGAFLGAIATKKLGIPFPFTLVVGIVAGATTAAVIGVVALRVRGLYLAVATLIFAFVSDRYLFIQPWLVESQSGTSIGFQAIGEKGTLPYFDLGSAKVFYYFALAVAAFSVYAIANLRGSKVGRAFGAIRGSETAAASLGINVTRYKLLGFALSGALAGLGGAITLVGARTVAPQQFDFANSLYFLAIAAVGGLRSLGGAVASSLLFALLVGEVFFRYPDLADSRDLISAGLLLAVLLFFRGGLGAVPEKISGLAIRLEPFLEESRSRLRPVTNLMGWVVRTPGQLAGKALRLVVPILRPVASVRAFFRRIGPFLPSILRRAARPDFSPARTPIDVVAIVERASYPGSSSYGSLPTEAGQEKAESRDSGDVLRESIGEGLVAGEGGPDGRRVPVLLSAENITVRFGGLTAVDGASIKVGAGEIVGLIGPNGAGKTTLFNSILGLNDQVSGTVHLFGQDATKWDVHERAALGVGRTFQILQLFPDLSVFENLLAATHLQNPTGLGGALIASKAAMNAELAVRRRVRAVLRLMELEDLADRPVAGLPFGVLRLIEVARTLVAGAHLVCFDEPASGLDTAETDRLLEWFRLLRLLGITLLVIEHDVSMVLRLCDYIYVLDQGRLISEGTPEYVRNDEAVISAYLGAVPAEVA